MLSYQYNDGGRAASGFKGDADDCVCRAIAIGFSLPYLYVYSEINSRAKKERVQRESDRSSARDGVQRQLYRNLIEDLGGVWTAHMTIGSGCQVHLHDGEIPETGRYILRVSKHITTVIDGVINDSHDPRRDTHVVDYSGDEPTIKVVRRCVYGWWEVPTNG